MVQIVMAKRELQVVPAAFSLSACEIVTERFESHRSGSVQAAPDGQSSSCADPQGHSEAAMQGQAARQCCRCAAMSLILAISVAAVSGTALTADEMRGIALASAPDTAASARFAGGNGLQHARDLGIPANETFLSRHPGAEQVSDRTPALQGLTLSGGILFLGSDW